MTTKRTPSGGLHCNVLWMTSPKADLSLDKEEQFNHAALVSQFLSTNRISHVLPKPLPSLLYADASD